jgi:AcrR family transcriptional regulator
MKKVDRRVLRTRQLLRNSLMTLILEKGYDSVTVQEITDHANLGRATFYLHYKDKEELLLTSLEAIIDELAERIGPPSSFPDDAPIVMAFAHAREHSALYRVILSGQGGIAAHRRMRQLIARRASQYLALIESDLSVPLDVITHYFAGALLNFVAWWLESDMPYTVDEMVRYFRRFHLLGMIDLVEDDGHLRQVLHAQRNALPLDAG